jgi:RNA 2',3'-cyclic 3'-phosphodiesterase
MKRLFIAVPVQLSEDFQKLSVVLQQKMARDQITWVKPKLQHLTLRFLGATPESQIDSIKKILRKITDDQKQFSLKLDKMGVFGSRYAPTTIWYGFNEFALFRVLFEKLESELLNIGIEPNHGNFVPHLTVGRIKKIENKNLFTTLITQLQPTFFQEMDVHAIHLIQSKLTTQGPIYRTIEQFPLK